MVLNPQELIVSVLSYKLWTLDSLDRAGSGALLSSFSGNSELQRKHSREWLIYLGVVSEDKLVVVRGCVLGWAVGMHAACSEQCHP